MNAFHKLLIEDELLSATEEGTFWTGIGSRSLPDGVADTMSIIAAQLERKGFTLHSGNADGADISFARGVDQNAKIFLPWESFNAQYMSELPNHEYIVVDKSDTEAYDSVNEFHPRGSSLDNTSRAFMARNYRQVVGHGRLSSFIICWTPNGDIVGGTGQCLRIAHRYHIPIINLANEDDLEFACEYIINI